MWFIDTDVLIQSVEQKMLKDIIRSEGVQGFIDIEAKHLMTVEASNAIIATGGSAVYSDKAMRKLKADSLTVYLNVPIEEIKRRVSCVDQRGVVLEGGQSIDQLYVHRSPLYAKYADITVLCDMPTLEENVEKVVAAIRAADQ